MIKFIDLRQKLKTAQYNALVLYGTDVWLKRKAISYVAAYCKADEDGYGITTLENPSDEEEIVLACLTPSMFGGIKTVVAENYVLPQGKRGQEAKKRLSSLIAGNDGGFFLLFTTDSDKPFEDIAGLEKVDCRKLDTENVINWIISYARKENVEVDRLTAGKIAMYCLNDMSRVSSETRKLLDYGEITPDSVELLVHRDAEYLVFDLGRAIADRNAARATEMYRSLIERGEEARYLFAVLYNFYRRVYYVKISGFPVKTSAEYLGVKEQALSFAKQIADRYKPMQLKRALEYLDEADVEIKKFYNENDVMNRVIMKLLAL